MEEHAKGFRCAEGILARLIIGLKAVDLATGGATPRLFYFHALNYCVPCMLNVLRGKNKLRLEPAEGVK